MSESRRSFLTKTVATTTAASYSRILGANDKVRLGWVGTGGRGQHLMNMAKAAGGNEIVAICDAWDRRMDEAEKLIGHPVSKVFPYRKLLERKDIDAVVVATVDHTHAPITVAACQAGKDVFVEKPMTSVPMQGHEIVKAQRAAKRVIQVGVQQRSLANFIEAKQRFVDSGMLGKVHMVRTIWNANTGYLTPAPAGSETKPAGLDWDAVLDWLPKRPWDPKRYFNRFAYWDFATGGQTGGLFVHMVDVVHWYCGVNKPLSAVAQGGIYQYNDGRDTPDNINFLLDYPGGLNVSFEATITDLIPRESADIIFFGEKGRLNIFRYGYRFLSAADKGKEPITAGGSPEPAHMANFLECVRTRKEPNATALDGHYAAMACHIGNIAYQEKRRVEWKPEWDV
jgi:predicted dehydrogenase